MSEEKRTYHGFGGKLHHDVPSWVRDDAVFHLRIRCAPGQIMPLTSPDIAPFLMESARFYQDQSRWWLDVLVLMPDHLHALVSFPQNEGMTEVIGSWKRYHARMHGIQWQENFFEHRVRNHDGQLQEKRDYILRNPMALGLCAAIEEWPWTYRNEGGWPVTRP